MRILLILIIGSFLALLGCTNECGLLPADTNVALIGLMRKDSAGNIVRWNVPNLLIRRSPTDTLAFGHSSGKYLCHLQADRNQTNFIFEDSLRRQSELRINFVAQKRIVPPNCGMYFIISQITAQLIDSTLFDSLQVKQTQIIPKDTAIHLLLYLK